jgi:hypothetical protein
MKIRATRRALRRPRAMAFTLIELAVGIGLSTVAALVIGFLTVFGARTFVAMGNYVDLDEQSRNAVDVISREVRNASAVVSIQTHLPVMSLTLTNDSTAQTVKLTYNANARTLVMTKTGQQAVTNLTQCDRWNFMLYDRAPIISSNNVTFHAATNAVGQLDPSFCKLINMTWECSRTILGAKLTTESVQTAQIVLRNKVN